MYRFPGTELDKRIEGRDVYLFDTSTLTATVLDASQQQWKKRSLLAHCISLRETPERAKYCADEGISQLRALKGVIAANSSRCAEQKKELKAALFALDSQAHTRTEPYEKALAQEQRRIFEIVQELPRPEIPEYFRFIAFVKSSCRALSASGKGYWIRHSSKRFLSHADISLAATTLALAYQGKSVACFTRNIGVRQVIMDGPQSLDEQLPASCVLLDSPLSALNTGRASRFPTYYSSQ